ncbi:MAG: uridine diphosphate-N-acetylglucosamine-binding protein YvcK [Synergistaceae bacterium]|nr:uridine diphosphate-N-acetylglucosamine-binding protein YvcK [Synergistaceae bacterium]
MPDHTVWIATAAGFLVGCALTALLPDRNLRKMKPPGGGYKRRDVMGNAIEHRLLQGPRFVCVGGGTGLSTLLAGLKSFTRNITAVVAVTDEGGSSGRLRQEWGVLPPGDVRNCLVALAENDNSLNRLLNFRFDRGELNGHSLGNLILLAACELVGDFSKAVEEMNRLLAIRGRVLPVTTETVVLHGETLDGKLVHGELDVSDNGSEMKRMWLEPSSAKPLADVIDAIPDADIIVLGPGSLFTSILPNLLLEEAASAIRKSPAPKVYVANLMTQTRETEGMNITSHLDWIASVLGAMPDYVVANQTPIPADYLERYREKGAEPLYLSRDEERYLEGKGCAIVYADLVNIKDGKYLRHHSQNLAEILMRIARDSRD